MEAYILILGVVNILVILVTYSNIKRISALERDLSEKEIIKNIHFIKEPEVQNNTVVNGHHRIEVYKGLGIDDDKAEKAYQLALENGWKLLDIQQNIKMVRFIRTDNGDVQKINIYYGGKKGKRYYYTVATALNHPTKGKTQLFRKGIDEKELRAILDQPRVHTFKGYYRGT